MLVNVVRSMYMYCKEYIVSTKSILCTYQVSTRHVICKYLRCVYPAVSTVVYLQSTVVYPVSTVVYSVSTVVYPVLPYKQKKWARLSCNCCLTSHSALYGREATLN